MAYLSLRFIVLSEDLCMDFLFLLASIDCLARKQTISLKLRKYLLLMCLTTTITKKRVESIFCQYPLGMLDYLPVSFQLLGPVLVLSSAFFAYENLHSSLHDPQKM